MRRSHNPSNRPPYDTPSEPEEMAEFALGDGPDPLIVSISDLRQWQMCPRVVYYQHLMRDFRPLTYVMRAGMEAHEEVRKRERRRKLRAYGIPDGKRHFDVWLYTPDLGLSGLVDMVIERDNELIPVDFKDSRYTKARNVAIQVAGYGILLEHLWQRPVERGFVYSIPRRRAHEVRLTTRMRRTIEQTRTAIRKAIEKSQLPPPTRKRSLCVSCEFRRFCNDIF